MFQTDFINGPQWPIFVELPFIFRPMKSLKIPEKLTFEGQKATDKIGLEQLSSIFLDFDSKHLERTYPMFSIFKELQ